MRALAGRKSSGLETTRASDLRHHSLDVESLLWQRLRNRRLGAKFRRQEPILGFTVDFVDHERGLVIELDGGGQHAERAAHDQRRIERLQQAGFRVLRFRGNDVIDDIDGVLETIHHALNAIPARRSPSGVPALAVDDDGGGP
ncbi:MAG TPA: endonuclease domain-containing protein [Azospirillaceae bacterium]|nr:endonuclease domain-containing protein [Azospirillaceae bacterium]